MFEFVHRTIPDFSCKALFCDIIGDIDDLLWLPMIYNKRKPALGVKKEK